MSFTNYLTLFDKNKYSFKLKLEINDNIYFFLIK